MTGDRLTLPRELRQAARFGLASDNGLGQRARLHVTGSDDVSQPRGVPVGFQCRLGLGERQVTAAHHLPQNLVGLDFLVEAGTGCGCRPDVGLHPRAAEVVRHQPVQCVLMHRIGAGVAVGGIDSGLQGRGKLRDGRVRLDLADIVGVGSGDGAGGELAIRERDTAVDDRHHEVRQRDAGQIRPRGDLAGDRGRRCRGGARVRAATAADRHREDHGGQHRFQTWPDHGRPSTCTVQSASFHNPASRQQRPSMMTRWLTTLASAPGSMAR